ncbi:MAG TPA: PIG-L deacetylase family protein [Caulobacteraceae bacterium]|jgi:LmbE family N-acetylglucosaminyl deacetylase
MSLLDAIAAGGEIDARRVLIVTAHPDDETLAFGTLMQRLTGVRIALATDGSPRDMRTQSHLGFPSVEAYRDARHTELVAALAVAGLTPSALIRLDFPDKELAHNLAPFAGRLRGLCTAHGIQAVLTHAYEGGHPDHDAVAAGVALATRGTPIEVVEAPFYRSVAGRFTPHSFTPIPGARGVQVDLTPGEVERKRAMIDCFITQAPIFEHYRPRLERFRHAPAYDFTRPPNDGLVDYEREFFAWSAWAEATAPALAALR